MLALYVALGVEWAIWAGGVVSTSVWVKECSWYYGYRRGDATGRCLNFTR
jgi:hypothetical protein